MGLLAAGVVLFIAYMAVMGIGDDGRPVGLVHWVVGGILIGPGFGSLIRWRKLRDAARLKG